MIGFIGSVFSPYYASRRRGGAVDPEQHCAFNVALCGASARRWSMTERPGSSLVRDDKLLQIGPSAMRWGSDGLAVDINEWTVPWPRRVKGRLQVTPGPLNRTSFVLCAKGNHVWRPIAPIARIEVDLLEPKLKWSGSAYFDCNFGDAPLDEAFSHWDWSRASLADGSTAVFYDAARRDQDKVALALRFAPDGAVSTLTMPRPSTLPNSAWGLRRAARTEAAAPRLVASLEDGPFYSRAVIDAEILGMQARAVHETLSLDRFRQRWVQALLPFRMPRMAL